MCKKILNSFRYLPIILILSQNCPGQVNPEVSKFEPVDATDMVNLYTGNFTYNIPLLEIPGPEGGFPINIFYNAGIGPNQPASWVGLGWDINPGSINRFVQGYPDDYFGGQVVSNYRSDKKKGKGILLGISYGPIGISLNFEAYTGQVGVNAYYNLAKGIDVIDFWGVGGLVQGNARIYAGTSGVGVATGLSLSFTDASGIGSGIGINADYNLNSGVSYSGGASVSSTSSGMSLVGVSFSSTGSSNYSVGGIGFQGQSTFSGHVHSKSSSFILDIPIGLLFGMPDLSISLGYYEWEQWIDETNREVALGILNQKGYGDVNYLVDQIWNTSNNTTVRL